MKLSRRAAAPALTLLVAACGGGAGQPAKDDLQTVDVTPQIDAAATLENDSVARPVGLPAGGIAGALPSDFPREVPLPSPSSLVDFSSSAHETSVTLAVDLPPDQVRQTYLRQLAAAGFAARPDGSHARGGRTVRFGVAELHGATRLTVRVARP